MKETNPKTPLSGRFYRFMTDCFPNHERQLSEDVAFAELGMDSLDANDLVLRLQTEFDADLTHVTLVTGQSSPAGDESWKPVGDEEAVEAVTLGELEAILAKKLGQLSES